MARMTPPQAKNHRDKEADIGGPLADRGRALFQVRSSARGSESPTLRSAARITGSRAKLLLTAAFIFSLSACSSTKNATRVDDGQLAGLSKDALAQVDQQRNALNQAKLDVESARKAEQEAKSRKDYAETEVEVAKARLEQAKIQQEMKDKRAEKRSGSKDSDSKDREESNVEKQAEAELKAAKAKVEYLDQLAKVASSELTLTERYVDLAEARLEQAKFNAIAAEHPDRISEMDNQSQDFVRQSASAQSDLASARADLAEKRAKALESYESWLSKQRDLEPTARRGVTPPAPTAEPTP